MKPKTTGFVRKIFRDQKDRALEQKPVREVEATPQVAHPDTVAWGRGQEVGKP